MKDTKKPTAPRTSLACNLCRRKKIRCDSGHPKCGNCVHSDSECVYFDIRKANAKPKNTQLDRIEAMVEQLLRDSAQKYDDGSHPSEKPCSLSPDTISTSPPAELEEQNKPPLDTFNSMRIQVSSKDDAVYSFGSVASIVLSEQFMNMISRKVTPLVFNNFKMALTDLLSLMKSHVDLFAGAENEVIYPSTIPSQTIDWVAAAVEQAAPGDTLNTLVTPEEFYECKRVSEKYPLASQTAAHITLFNATIAYVLSQYSSLLDGAFTLDVDPADVDNIIRVASRKAVRAYLIASLTRPTLTFLKGTLMILSFSIHSIIPLSSEISLSRKVLELCVDFGLNRRSYYKGMDPKESRRYQTIFWLSYVSNRTICLRCGCSPYYLHSFVELPPAMPHNSDLLMLRPSVELLRIFDRAHSQFWGLDEKESVRVMLRNLLELDVQLEKWVENQRSILGDFLDFAAFIAGCKQLNRTGTARAAIMLSSYFHLAFALHRMTAMAPATVNKYLKMMYPAEYASASRFTSDSPIAGSSPGSSNSASVTQWSITRALNAINVCYETSRKFMKFTRASIIPQQIPGSTSLVDLVSASMGMVTLSALVDNQQASADSGLIREICKSINDYGSFLRSEVSRSVVTHVLESCAAVVNSLGQTPMSETRKRSQEGECSTTKRFQPYGQSQSAESPFPAHLATINDAQNFESFVSDLFGDDFHSTNVFNRNQGGQNYTESTIKFE